jgi:hypothetical protein
VAKTILNGVLGVVWATPTDAPLSFLGFFPLPRSFSLKKKKKSLPLYLFPPISMSLAFNESINKPNLLAMEEQEQQELTRWQ